MDDMGERIERLKKYKGAMERMYFFFLVFIIVTEFFKSTVVMQDLILLGVYGLSYVTPQMTISTANLIFGSILSLPLLIAIPAVYVIAVEMNTKKERITAIILVLLGWFYSIYMRKWDDIFLFRTMLLIVASYGKDFKRIAKKSIIVVAICLLITTILSLTKVIPEFNLERNGRVRHSFGIMGPTGYAAHISMIIVTMIFIKNGVLKWYDYMIIVIMTAFNVVFIDGRVSLLTTILAVGGMLIYRIMDQKDRKIPEKAIIMIRWLLAHSYLIVAAVFFLMVLTYRGEEGAFYRHIPFLSTFEGRIEVPHRLLKELGLSVFGNFMPNYGSVEYSFYQSGTYNYLDSSYSRMLMIYGVVGLALTLWIFTKAEWRLMEKKQTFRMYLLAVLALDYVVERFLMDPMYHVFMLLFFAVIPEPEEKEAEYRGGRSFYTGEREADGTLRRAYEGLDMREVYRKKPLAYKIIKRLGDIVGSFFALILLSPFFLITAIAVKAGDGGPVFFSGLRFGKDMKLFPMHKFRSMCVGAEEMTKDVLHEGDKNGLAYKIKNDPRITRVGSIIRRASIDELPQFWNVLKGQMSLVGPRPIQTTDKEINDYEKQRWIVKPGITCYWQVCGRSDVTWDEWVEMDLKYINEMSILTDLKLLLATVARFWKRTERRVE